MQEAGHSGSFIYKGNLELGKRFSKDEDLNSIPNVHVKRLGRMVDACDPDTGEAETGGPLGRAPDQRGIPSHKTRNVDGHVKLTSDLHAYVHTQSCSLPHVCTCEYMQ